VLPDELERGIPNINEVGAKGGTIVFVFPAGDLALKPPVMGAVNGEVTGTPKGWPRPNVPPAEAEPNEPTEEAVLRN
jgi:hypothetical protein